MNTSENTSSSFDDAEGQPFVWDQNPDDTSSDSSEDLPPAHAYLDEISGSINEDYTPSTNAGGSRDSSVINIPLSPSANSSQSSANYGASPSFQGSVDMSLDSFKGNTVLPPELTSAIEPANVTPTGSPSPSVSSARSTNENISVNRSPLSLSVDATSTSISTNDSLPPLPPSSNTTYASSVGSWSADMDLTSVVAPGQIPAPNTPGSVQASEQSTRSVPRSPLSSQPSDVPSPTKSSKSHSYSGLFKGSGAEVRPSSRTSTSSGRRSSSRHSDNGETRRRVSSPSWHGSEILASSGIAWKETQELREKLTRSLAINDALQRDVKRLEQSLQHEKDRAEKAELAAKDERRLAREALEKAELKAQRDEEIVERRAMRELEKAEQRATRAEAAAEEERKWAREAVEKVQVRAWQAVDKAETNAKEKEEYRIQALMAEAEVKDLKAKYERGK
ncbi:hypothetical protein C0993_007307 [Termitomyces sp. T159_Od127]|nr:hypothetical protein C0993_007307 [Termitomyces sp. T159_Od127]